MLGNLLELVGFDFEDIESLRGRIAVDLAARARQFAFNPLAGGAVVAGTSSRAELGHFERIGEFPLYRADPLVRRAPSLQARSGGLPQVDAHPDALFALGVTDGTRIRVRQGEAVADLPLVADGGLPQGSVRIPAAWPETLVLGALAAPVQLERLA